MIETTSVLCCAPLRGRCGVCCYRSQDANTELTGGAACRDHRRSRPNTQEEAPMTYRRVAGSCSNGPCPTIYVDDETGDALVQGFRTTDQPTGLPTGEDVVKI